MFMSHFNIGFVGVTHTFTHVTHLVFIFLCLPDLDDVLPKGFKESLESVRVLTVIEFTTFGFGLTGQF